MDMSVLTHKVGPLPVWAYGAGIGGIALLLASRNKKGGIAGDYSMPVPENAGGIVGDTGGDGGTAPHDPPLYPGPIDDPIMITDPGFPWHPKPGDSVTPRGINGPVLDISDPITSIPTIINRSIAPSPAAGAASGNSTKTFSDSIANLAKSLGTPLYTVGNYFTADPTKKPDWVDPNKSNSVTVPRIPGMTQAPTLQDIWTKSQQQIAASPSLQQQIANANVQESQRKNAIVGEGGTLMFLDENFLKTHPEYRPK